MFKFTDQDIQQLNLLGITKEQVDKYIQIFKQGIPFSEVRSAANINQGIDAFSKDELNRLVEKYEENTSLKVIKFTPASGAATRMFKAMHQLMDKSTTFEKFKNEITKDKYADLKKIVNQLENLPFYKQIVSYIEDFDQLSREEKAFKAFKTMLNPSQLGLAELPKGLIPFHTYENDVATAFEEHFYEAADYASKNAKANLHFTISEEHQQKFKDSFKKIESKLVDKTGVQFELSFSFQKKSTDTLAVDMENNPFRLSNGRLLFRPGGHGALIENLNDVDADIIFIKNIDNISHRNNLKSNSFYKKALAGYLLEVQKNTFQLIKQLNENPDQSALKTTENFLRNTLNVSQNLETVEQMLTHLNKPIRVCGMVKNEGEPGGGPYWMVNGNGNTSLQIVEKSQIDLNNESQIKILSESTHFNPVDLVCGVRNYKGEKFNLLDYVNSDRGFITEKSVEGKPLKALELPGLWNGAMEYWNTLFVEVPSSTFCPVKSVNDLLKPLHVSGKPS